MTRPDDPHSDETAYYAAWLGKLWPTYRAAFAPGGDPVDFEWRAAAYPLWLAVPGLVIPLAVLAAVVLATAATGAAEMGSWRLDLTLYLAGVALVFWPGVFLVLTWLWLSGELSGSVTVWPVAMFVVSAALGRFTPRWIVAKGRRRWHGRAAHTSAGAAPAPPRSVTAFRPLYALALAVAAFLLVRPFFTGHNEAHERALVAAMKADLRNLVTAQEDFFADSVRFTRDLAALDYATANAVTVEIVAAGDSGWAATARSQETAMVCAIFVGNAAPPLPGAVEGEVSCAEPEE